MDESVEIRLARIEERLTAMSEALKLQAKEYERRLMDLNHAHDKQVADQATYVTGDTFHGFIKEMQALQRSVDSQFAELKGGVAGAAKTRSATHQSWVLVLMGLGVVVAIALALLP